MVGIGLTAALLGGSDWFEAAGTWVGAIGGIGAIAVAGVTVSRQLRRDFEDRLLEIDPDRRLEAVRRLVRVRFIHDVAVVRYNGADHLMVMLQIEASPRLAEGLRAVHLKIKDSRPPEEEPRAVRRGSFAFVRPGDSRQITYVFNEDQSHDSLSGSALFRLWGQPFRWSDGEFAYAGSEFVGGDF